MRATEIPPKTGDPHSYLSGLPLALFREREREP